MSDEKTTPHQQVDDLSTQIMHLVLRSCPDVMKNARANALACVALTQNLGMMMSYLLMHQPDVFETSLEKIGQIVRKEAREVSERVRTELRKGSN